MKKILIIFLLITGLISCKNETINLAEINIENTDDLLKYNQDYFLFIHADWCTYCQKTIPYTKQYFKNNTKYKAQYLNIDTLNENLKKDLYYFLNIKMKISDPSNEKGRILVPNISLFKNNELYFSKTGLGTTKESTFRNIENIIKLSQFLPLYRKFIS